MISDLLGYNSYDHYRLRKRKLPLIDFPPLNTVVGVSASVFVAVVILKAILSVAGSLLGAALDALGFFFTTHHPHILPHSRFVIVDGFLTPFSLNIIYYDINAGFTIKCEFRDVLIYNFGY